jgi:hypothetical protein
MFWQRHQIYVLRKHKQLGFKWKRCTAIREMDWNGGYRRVSRQWVLVSLILTKDVTEDAVINHRILSHKSWQPSMCSREVPLGNEYAVSLLRSHNQLLCNVAGLSPFEVKICLVWWRLCRFYLRLIQDWQEIRGQVINYNEDWRMRMVLLCL